MIDWSKLDSKNFVPDGEVLAGNFEKGTHGYKETLVGRISINYFDMKCICESESEILSNVTHWSYLNTPEDV